MSHAARVTSIEALEDLKLALCAFKDDGQDALCQVELTIRRTFDWLRDQHQLWKREVRIRYDEVVQAKAVLTTRKMTKVAGRTPDCTEQEDALERAEQRLREAHEKVEKCRRWEPALQREVDEHIGPIRRLAALFEGEWPKALALLDRKLAALDAYVALAPQAASAPSVAVSSEPQSVVQETSSTECSVLRAPSSAPPTEDGSTPPKQESPGGPPP